MRAVLYVLSCSILISTGQVLWKFGLNKLEINRFFEAASFKKIATSPFILTGFGIYIIATVYWMYLLNSYKLSYVYPLLSMTYLITLAFSYIFLKEGIPLFRWFGVLFILIGVYLITRTK